MRGDSHAFLLCATFVAGCGSSGSSMSNQPSPDAPLGPAADASVAPKPDAAAPPPDARQGPDGSVAGCDPTHRPILFVHGFSGSGDNFEIQAQRFTSNGYCPESIQGFDYDSGLVLTGALATVQPALDTAVDALRTASGFDQ